MLTAPETRSVRLGVEIRVVVEEGVDVTVEGDLEGYGELVEETDPDTGQASVVLALDLVDRGVGLDPDSGLPYSEYVEVRGRTLTECASRLLRIAADESYYDSLAVQDRVEADRATGVLP